MVQVDLRRSLVYSENQSIQEGPERTCGFQFSSNRPLGVPHRLKCQAGPAPGPHLLPLPRGGVLRRGLRRKAFSLPSAACSQERI